MTTKVQEPAAAGGKTGSGDAAASGVSPALALLAGWLVRRSGTLLLGKWVRAGLLMLSIVGMFAIGIALAGKVYTPNTGEPLDMLGFAGNLDRACCTGWRGCWAGDRPRCWTAVADYRAKFIVVAGLLNVVAAVDAHSLASGRKPS